VADTGNGAVRMINLKQGKMDTLSWDINRWFKEHDSGLKLPLSHMSPRECSIANLYPKHVSFVHETPAPMQWLSSSASSIDTRGGAARAPFLRLPGVAKWVQATTTFDPKASDSTWEGDLEYVYLLWVAQH
jgi:hypothetical protein